MKIRTLKPTIWEDEDLGTAPLMVRVVFIGLITMADDEGRLRAAPALVRSQLFPYDEDVTAADVGAALLGLHELGMVRLYGSPDGRQRYAEIANWAKHQRIRADKFQPSQLPPPSSTNPLVKSGDVQEKTPPIPPEGSPETVPRPPGREGNGTEWNGRGRPSVPNRDGSERPPKRQAKTAEQILGEIAAARAALNGSADLADQLCDLVAAENKTGKAAESRLLRTVWSPLAKAMAAGMTDHQMAYGLQQAVQRGVPNAIYALKAAANAPPPGGHARPVPTAPSRRTTNVDYNARARIQATD